ncbi:hypothetical protein PGT21_025979 [Puccinia graminis f. sp. tritici]|uniref:HlyIII-domain-containing protein n=1 Tax=Puccinia graminis f. sp. tritici TaxID=56615 RepID=A0A5B0PYM2_PUCGR|nr:hypothetical protein PGT21_025979 [Puccinia graminis f. sp. tritici]
MNTATAVSPRRSKSLSSHHPTQLNLINSNNNNHNQQIINLSFRLYHHSQPQSIQSLDLPPISLLPTTLISLYSTLNDHLKLVQVSLKLINNSKNHHHHQSTEPQSEKRITTTASHSSRSDISSSSTSGSQTNSSSSSRSSRSNSTTSPTTNPEYDYHRLLSFLIKNEKATLLSREEEDDGQDNDEKSSKTVDLSFRFPFDVSSVTLRSPNQLSSLPSLTTFVQQVTHYIHQLKIDLFSTHQLIFNLPESSSPSASRSTTIYTSLTDFNLKQPLDRLAGCLPSIPDPNQLVERLTFHSQKLDELLSQLSFLSQYPTHFPSLPILLPEALSNSGHQRALSFNQITPEILKSFPSPNSLRQYFSEESDRLASLLPGLPTGLSESIGQTSNQITSALRACKEEAQAVLHDGEVFIREEGEKLKGWVDSETEKLRLALQMGTSRLLTYHELPDEWKNNQFIVKGYRFIPLDRWHHLLLSGIQWHNETINIHTHFFGTLSLFYLLFFLWPTTPHTAPDSSTMTDRVISLIFLVCAIKCLICSTAWHLFSGCGTLGPFRRLACVDYVGISGLIAASVMSMEYYGFYCRPGLAGLYMSFTVAMGIIGMILPFQPFFDRPESKGIRIVFFVSMAGSALIPQAHMAYLYGLRETFHFYYPALPSVISYLAGLFFYATNWPERIRPGWVFDTLFHSHQFWHVAIVAAIWLHWRAIGIIHDSGRLGFSCSAQAIEQFHNTPTPSLISAWPSILPNWLF